MTALRAKGREFDAVIVLDANDEIWPGSSGHHSQIDIYSGQKASIGIRARF